MRLDPATFLLEIVNFLVLVWLLTRFLYRPIRAGIRRRQQQEEDARRAIAQERDKLDADRQALAQAKAELAAEREARERALAAELAAERTRRLAELDAELGEERAKAQSRVAAARAEEARERDAEAERRAAVFVQAYLQRLAGPELERAIADLLVGDLASLDAARVDTLRRSVVDGPVEIATAYPAPAAMRQNVESALQASLGRAVTARWRVDRDVIAGVSVRLDGCLLEASLARALDAFAAEPRGTT